VNKFIFLRLCYLLAGASLRMINSLIYFGKTKFMHKLSVVRHIKNSKKIIRNDASQQHVDIIIFSSFMLFSVFNIAIRLYIIVKIFINVTKITKFVHKYCFNIINKYIDTCTTKHFLPGVVLSQLLSVSFL